LFILTRDGSVTNEHGKIIYFSADRFIDDIVDGGACFICGAQPGTTEFNSEHILPNWIIRRYGLHNKQVNLPNDTGHRYTIPCCKSCNDTMSAEFEKPISEIVKQGYDALVNYIRQEGPRKLFVWLSLIFLKAHLKDRLLPLHPDPREGSARISDVYAWEDLHHIHCIARSFYSGAVLDPSAYGSVFILPAKAADPFTAFDYIDLYRAQTLLLRMDGIALLAVLNDACACFNALQEMFTNISAPLSPLQLRELFARLADANLSLETRPMFKSNIKAKEQRVIISSDHPETMSFKQPDPGQLGTILLHSVQEVLTALGAIDDVDAISQGKWSSLYSPDGTFNNGNIE